jgi:hypothetical protein
VHLVISFSVGIMIFIGLKMRLRPYEYAVREKVRCTSALNFPRFHELFCQASGTEKQSFVASLLDQDIPSDKHQDEWADIIAWTAGSMYGGVQIVKTINGAHSHSSRFPSSGRRNSLCNND